MTDIIQRMTADLQYFKEKADRLAGKPSGEKARLQAEVMQELLNVYSKENVND